MTSANVPLNYLTATETAKLVQSGMNTVADIARAHIERYKQRNANVEAWAYIDQERVMREAARLDAVPKGERGPLHGLVLGVKDMIQTADMPTQHGSEIYKGHEPGVDAGIVAILRTAGVLIYGKTVTTEYAFMTVGQKTMNPFDKRRTPGGSSSGSAAAVADWQCQVALGTQTIGSMMRPSSFNGVYGFKPTYGSITKEGLKPSSLTLDSPGYFARSLADIQLLSSVLRVTDDQPPIAKPISARRFAFVKTSQWAPADRPAPSKELVRAWEKAQELLKAQGADVTELDLPVDFDAISRGLNMIILHAEAATLFLPEVRLDRAGVAPGGQSQPAKGASGDSKVHADVTAVVEGRLNPSPSKAEYLKALDELARLRPIFDEIASDYDAIVTPSAPGIALEGLEWTGDSRFCGMWTALHVPVVNIPAFASEEGMPLGLTLVGARFKDQQLLSVAEQVASAWVGPDRERTKCPPAPAGVQHVLS